MSDDRPKLPLNQENLDRLTLALEHMADAAADAARRAEVGIRHMNAVMMRLAARPSSPVLSSGADEREQP